MSQLSPHVLKPEIHDSLIQVLMEVIASTDKTKSGRLFTHHFLSAAEQIMLAKRVGIALLLKRGYTYELTMNYLKVSRGTVAKVAEILNEQGSESQKILDQIIQEKNIKKVLGNLEYLLSKIIPPKGRNWTVWRTNLEKEKRKNNQPI